MTLSLCFFVFLLLVAQMVSAMPEDELDTQEEVQRMNQQSKPTSASALGGVRTNGLNLTDVEVMVALFGSRVPSRKLQGKK